MILWQLLAISMNDRRLESAHEFQNGDTCLEFSTMSTMQGNKSEATRGVGYGRVRVGNVISIEVDRARGW